MKDELAVCVDVVNKVFFEGVQVLILDVMLWVSGFL